MRKKITILLTILLMLPTIGITSQNNTNSPYTRFGYGQLEENCFSRSQAMGGTSIGMRSKTGINPVNPASYSSIDSTSFIFEIGVSGLLTNLRSGKESKTEFNGNLDYIALQTPITKWMGLSLGIIPYSYVGYNYNFTDSFQLPNKEAYNTYAQSYSGSGGISQLYLGLSFDIANHFSIGANAYYMFGNINHYKSILYTQSDLNTTLSLQKQSLHVRSFNGRFGIQYHETIGKKHAFVIGAIYEFKSPMQGTFENTMIGIDTIITASSNVFELPSLYGGGVSYTYDNRLTIAADYTYQEFSKAKYYNTTDTLCNRSKITLGAEYINDPYGRKYVDRILWRIGANYSNSYIKIGDKQTHDFSITCGIGLPLRTSKTMININFEYGNVGTVSLLKEQYFKFGINFSLNEMWFIKAKIR